MNKMNSKWLMMFGLLALGLTISACIPGQQANNTNQNNGTTMADESNDDAAMLKDQEAVEAENSDGTMMEDKKADSVMKDDEVSYSGTVLAGTKSLVLDFNQQDYNQALAANKTILLYFYANWCPTCAAEVPKMYSAFNQLDSDQIVAFRVNYKDNETDSDEAALAQQFGVAYQHTKVAIKNGQRVLKAPDSWDQEKYISEVNKLLN